MSFQNDSDSRYSYSFTSDANEAERRAEAAEAARAAEREEHKREMSRLRRSMTKMVAGICAVTLVLGIGGGALVGSLTARNSVAAVEAPAASSTALFSNAAASSETASPETAAPETTAPASTGAVYATSSASSSDMSSADVYSLVSSSVVSIVTEYQSTSGYYQQSTASGAGSGVIISADGYVVTNNHVIENATKITVTLSDGTDYEAELLGSDDVTDVALLKIDASDLSYAVMGDSDNVRVGDTANVIGNPLGRLSGTLTVGVISGLDRAITMSDGTTMTLIQMDAAVNPGNSGGGVFNSRGELIGITVAKTSATDVEGIGYAIPIDNVIPILNDLSAQGYVTGRPALGISVVEIDDQWTAMMYRVSYLGVYVTGLSVDNGLQVGDYIVSIDGESISSTANINSILQNHVAGDTVDVVVYRSGSETTVSVTLVEEGTLNADSSSQSSQSSQGSQGYGAEYPQH